MTRHLLCLTLLLSGCLSARDRNADRRTDELNQIATRLGTTQINQCDLDFKPDWPLTVFHKHPRFIEHDGKLILLYDLVGKNRSRTIWQPLDPDYRFLGDGIAVGHPKATKTEDFQIFADGAGNLWTSFRFRLPNRMTYNAAIEFLNKNPGSKLSRLLLPVPVDESVQQLWVLPPRNPSDDLSVVVKTYDVKQTDSQESWSDRDTPAIYRWFRVSPVKNLVKEVRSFRSPSDALGELTFIAIGEQFEPLAIAIERTTLKSGTAPEPVPAQRVTATRVFHTKGDKTILFQAPRALLSSLDARLIQHSSGMALHVAWVNELDSSKKNLIQWVSLGFSSTDTELRTLFLEPMLVTNKQQSLVQSFLPLSHYPTRLNWREIQADNDGAPSTVLTWLAALNEDLVYMATAPLPVPLPRGGPNPSGLFSGTDTKAILAKESTSQIYGIYTKPSARGDTLALYSPKPIDEPSPDIQNPGGIAGETAPDMRICLYRLMTDGGFSAVDTLGKAP